MYIEKIKGTYLQALPGGALVDVNGVGYGIEMPLTAMCQLPAEGQEVSFWTYTHVREDAIRLFGFPTYVERYCFEVLISLNGVGPKLALAIMSTMTIGAIAQAVQQGNSEAFAQTPGVGKRLSEKLLLELKPKIQKLTACLDPTQIAEHKMAKPAFESSALIEDVRSALENFGYRENDINSAVKKLAGLENPGVSFSELMRRALVELNALLPKHQVEGATKITPETDLF